MRFNEGDRIKCIKSPKWSEEFTVGKIYTVGGRFRHDGCFAVKKNNQGSEDACHCGEWDFKLVRKAKKK